MTHKALSWSIAALIFALAAVILSLPLIEVISALGGCKDAGVM